MSVQVAGMRSNLWPGAAAVASGPAFTNVYVGWGIKTAPFLPLPPPPVAQEYDQVRHMLKSPFTDSTTSACSQLALLHTTCGKSIASL